MSWLTAAFKSSVGRKFLMGLTGLFLCLFLVLHLAGNLLLFVGQETYDEYAHKLHSNPELLVMAEILLFAAFTVHIALALSLTQTNNAARTQDYAVKRSKVPGRTLNLLGMTPDNTMVITGLVVFLFLTVHLSDFKFGWAWGEAVENLGPYAKAQHILADAGRAVIYLVGAIILGVHVSHGFASAFQSIGFNHPKYTPAIKSTSRVFGLVVAIGFGCIPVLFPKLMHADPASTLEASQDSTRTTKSIEQAAQENAERIESKEPSDSHGNPVTGQSEPKDAANLPTIDAAESKQNEIPAQPPTAPESVPSSESTPGSESAPASESAPNPENLPLPEGTAAEPNSQE